MALMLSNFRRFNERDWDEFGSAVCFKGSIRGENAPWRIEIAVVNRPEITVLVLVDAGGITLNVDNFPGRDRPLEREYYSNDVLGIVALLSERMMWEHIADVLRYMELV